MRNQNWKDCARIRILSLIYSDVKNNIDFFCDCHTPIYVITFYDSLKLLSTGLSLSHFRRVWEQEWILTISIMQNLPQSFLFRIHRQLYIA